MSYTPEQADLVKHMVNRFLRWKLPATFSPDCGISFKRSGDYEHSVMGYHIYEPVGTNLFSAEQAKAMVEYMLEGYEQQAKEASEVVPDEELRQELWSRLEEKKNDEWVVHKPEDAPYAGIRTRDGRTIAGTSSGLSVGDAEAICAAMKDREFTHILLNKITALSKATPQPESVKTALRKAAEIVARRIGHHEAVLVAGEILALIDKENAE